MAASPVVEQSLTDPPASAPFDKQDRLQLTFVGLPNEFLEPHDDDGFDIFHERTDPVGYEEVPKFPTRTAQDQVGFVVSPSARSDGVRKRHDLEWHFLLGCSRGLLP